MAVAIIATINVGLNIHRDNLSSLILSKIDVIGLAEGSNNSGSGNIYYYEHKLGDPKECTLYKFVNASGDVQYNTDGASVGVSYTRTQVSGIKETCPKNGNGCTVYSCHVTNNTNP